jgi:Zn-dependent protease
MRGPYSEYAAPPVYISPAGPKPGVHFSRTELFQLTVAILALSASFTILYVRSDPLGFARSPVFFLAFSFPASLLAVGTGVGLHEVMHKVVAQRYGLWAEFRYNLRGLAFAFIFAAAIGFLFGAPGATWISGAVTKEQNGRISAAGPVTNLAIAAVLFAGFLVMMPQASNFGGALVIVYLTRAAFVNAILAGFNMIPLMPLDGAKVWAWNKAIYVGVVAVALALIYVTLPRSF